MLKIIRAFFRRRRRTRIRIEELWNLNAADVDHHVTRERELQRKRALETQTSYI